MSERFFDIYNEFTFNLLLNALNNLEELEKENEYIVNFCKKIREKITTYYSVEKDSESDEKFIKIGWFGEELRELIYLFLIYYAPYSGEKDKSNIFKELVEQKEKNSQDPNYYTKCKIKHFSPNATFLSHEEEKLMAKGKAILKVLGENSNNLEMDVSDFPSRCWMLCRVQKTQETTYDFNEIPKGWEVTKIFQKKNEENAEKTVFTLDIETLEVTKNTETIYNLEKINDE